MNIKIVNINIGKFSSGNDLSGDIISSHIEKFGKSKEIILVEFSGHEQYSFELASNTKR